MSTIERAIIGNQAEETDRRSTVERAIDGDETSGEQSRSAPEALGAEEAPAPAADSVPSVTDPAAPRTEASVTPPAAQPAGNFVDIDLRNLEQQGFVLPETGPQRLAEEYRHIKRRILGNMVPGVLNTRRPANLVMITSSVPGEGKTFTSVNIALSIAAELDKTVLVIDSDIIKSDLTRAFGMKHCMGLFDYLENPDMGVEHVIYRSSIPSLSVIPAGHSGTAVSEKLASGAMGRLTDELASRYHDRIIIFDCPPILATSGATALAPHVSQVVMVVEARDTAQATVKDALNIIGQERVTGVILNKSKAPTSQSSYYYYGYYQPQQPAEPANAL